MGQRGVREKMGVRGGTAWTGGGMDGTSWKENLRILPNIIHARFEANAFTTSNHPIFQDN